MSHIVRSRGQALNTSLGLPAQDVDAMLDRINDQKMGTYVTWVSITAVGVRPVSASLACSLLARPAPYGIRRFVEVAILRFAPSVAYARARSLLMF